MNTTNTTLSISSINKQIILCIDITSNLLPYFQEILTNYIIPILKNEVQNQKNIELSLILFGDFPFFSDFLVNCSPFIQDFDLFLSWLTSITYLFKNNPKNIFKDKITRPLVEALCASAKICEIDENKKKYLLIISNSIPNEIACHSCIQSGDCYWHAFRLGKKQIFLSIISPQQNEYLQKIFDTAKTDQESSIKITKKIGNPTILLRELELKLELYNFWNGALNILGKKNIEIAAYCKNRMDSSSFFFSRMATYINSFLLYFLSKPSILSSKKF
jgi:hypothetical protein